MKNFRIQHLALVILLAFSGIVGCSGENSNSSTDPKAGAGSDHGHPHPHDDTNNPHSVEGHAHGAGPHDGTIADWGGGKFHVEFTVDHDKQEATVYILGTDEKTPTPISAESVLLTIKNPAMQIDLTPAPLDGDSDGKASRFTGTDASLATVREFEGTLSAVIEGTPYSGNFKEESHDQE